MTVGLLFWILMLIWLVFDVYRSWPLGPPFAGSLLTFILFLILGWHAFGAPIR